MFHPPVAVHFLYCFPGTQPSYFSKLQPPTTKTDPHEKNNPTLETSPRQVPGANDRRRGGARGSARCRRTNHAPPLELHRQWNGFNRRRQCDDGRRRQLWRGRIASARRRAFRQLRQRQHRQHAQHEPQSDGGELVHDESIAGLVEGVDVWPGRRGRTGGFVYCLHSAHGPGWKSAESGFQCN